MKRSDIKVPDALPVELHENYKDQIMFEHRFDKFVEFVGGEEQFEKLIDNVAKVADKFKKKKK